MVDRSQRWVEASLERGAELWVELRGASMEPALRDGDRLRIAPLGPDDPAPGHVVAFRRGGRVVAHRVVAREGEALHTRGDGNPRPDGPVARAEVLGRVVQVRRGRRLPRASLRSLSARRAFHWVRCRIGL